MTLQEARDVVANHRRALVVAPNVDASLLKALHTLDSAAVAILSIGELLTRESDGA